MIHRFKDRIELAMDANNDVIWDWNLQTNELYVSQKWKSIIGHDSQKTPYKIKVWRHHLHPEDRRAVFRAIEENIAGKTDYIDNIHRLRDKDGNWIWIHMRGKTYYDEDGVALRVTGTHRNITELKQLELKNLHQSQIIEQIHDSVVSIDLNGYITSWNRGSERMLGYSKEEALLKHISFIYLDMYQERFLQYIEELKDVGSLTLEVALLQKSQIFIYVELLLSLLRDDKGDIVEVIASAHDITEKKFAHETLQRQKEALDYQAHHDALTGLPNRILFHDRLKFSLQKSQREQKKFALFFLDLDKFKEINDSYGHDVGDAVLKGVATKLSAVLRKEDTFARIAGDEFTMIIENIKDAHDASVFAKKILKTLLEPLVIGKHTLKISMSIGISIYPENGANCEALLKSADLAMYRAKKEGRDTFQFYSKEMTELALERVVMEESLRTALESGDILLCYQPQINLQTNEIIAIETFVRWHHPVMGMLLPSNFLPLAKRIGLVVKIDTLVLKNAIREFSLWKKEGLSTGILALNLSKQMIQNRELPVILKALCQEYECQPEWIELEIGETQLMDNPEDCMALLEELAAMGVGIVVDNFGTGFSSLAYLQKLPLKKLKIDKSFIQNIEDGNDSLVKPVVALAESLNLEIVAEGVEDMQQQEILHQSGCNIIQGYHYSRPLSSQEMVNFLKNDIIIKK